MTIPPVEILLRSAIGAIFLASGALKLLAVHDPAFQTTGVWWILGQSRSAIVVASTLEATAGAALLFGVLDRQISFLSGVALIIASIWLKVLESGGRKFSGCGCFGSPRVEDGVQLPWEVRSLILILGLCVVALRRPAGPIEGGVEPTVKE